MSLEEVTYYPYFPLTWTNTSQALQCHVRNMAVPKRPAGRPHGDRLGAKGWPAQLRDQHGSKKPLRRPNHPLTWPQ